MIENAKIVSLLKEISEKENIRDYLLVIYGQFNQEIIISSIKLIEKKLTLEKFPTNIITKTKMICTEMLQNITKHQKSHEALLPYFIVGANDKTLNILSGNIISDQSRKIIETKMIEYASVNKTKLREYYIDAFNNSTLSNQGNAGLGLLEIFYRANQNVKYNMQKVSNGFFSFNLDVVVNKQVFST